MNPEGYTLNFTPGLVDFELDHRPLRKLRETSAGGSSDDNGALMIGIGP